MTRTLIAGLLLVMSAMSAVAAGEAVGGTVVPMPGAMTEAQVFDQLMTGGLANCCLTSASWGGVDECTIGEFPMICQRLDMNVPMSINEASDTQGGLGYLGAAPVNHMHSLNANVSPDESRNPIRVGAITTFSSSTQGHIAPMPLEVRGLWIIIDAIFVGNICTPLFVATANPVGYAFGSEGDHLNGTEFGNWRGIISMYWVIPWLMPLTAVSTAMDFAGLCPIDYYHIFCYGSNGTRYPSTGTNAIPSRGLNMTDSFQDGFNPTAAPLFFYGPLHVLPGTAITVAAHSQASYSFGVASSYAAIQRGAYIQPVYPTPALFCFNSSTADLNPMNNVIPAQALSLPITETQQIAAQDDNRAITAIMWPRFHCCMWCSVSNEAAFRVWRVGNGFLPQLVP